MPVRMQYSALRRERVPWGTPHICSCKLAVATVRFPFATNAWRTCLSTGALLQVQSPDWSRCRQMPCLRHSVRNSALHPCSLSYDPAGNPVRPPVRPHVQCPSCPRNWCNLHISTWSCSSFPTVPLCSTLGSEQSSPCQAISWETPCYATWPVAGRPLAGQACRCVGNQGRSPLVVTGRHEALGTSPSPGLACLVCLHFTFGAIDGLEPPARTLPIRCTWVHALTTGVALGGKELKCLRNSATTCELQSDSNADALLHLPMSLYRQCASHHRAAHQPNTGSPPT